MTRPRPTPTASARSLRPTAAVALALSLGAAALACAGAEERPATTPPTTHTGIPEELARRSPEEHLAVGAELYAAHCAACHGERGAADGELSTFLFPPPRDFADGRFKLVSSESGAPFDRDLVQTLRRGMPGSAMPAFGWLPEEDLWSLAAHVRGLAVDGLAARLTTQLAADGQAVDAAAVEARALAVERLTPTAAIEVPLRQPATDELLARGELLYRQRCAVCHGPGGEGRATAPRPDEDGTLNWARDFTAGYVKGGASYEALVHRIVAGMPGTAMGANDLPADDLRALAEHVRAMIPPGTENSLVQTRGHLLARHVDALPTGPDDDAWDDAVHLKVNLAPLAWVDEAVPAVDVAALHDGERLAVKVGWHDRTHDAGQGFEAGLADACALQFAAGEAPPLAGMGSALHPHTLLHWRAAWPEDFSDLLGRAGVPHGRSADEAAGAVLDAPVYRPALPEASQEARGLEATGPGRLDEVGPAPTAEAVWSDDSWRVVFVRALDPEEDGLLRAGATANLAIAVWNGAAGDHGARKALSIWQELALE